MDIMELLTAKQRSGLCEYNARRIGKERGIRFRRKRCGGVRGYLLDGSVKDFYGWVDAYNWIMEQGDDNHRQG